MVVERWTGDMAEAAFLSSAADTWEQLQERIAHRFGRVEVRVRVQRYLASLLARVERKNGWQLAEATTILLLDKCSSAVLSMKDGVTLPA